MKFIPRIALCLILGFSLSHCSTIPEEIQPIQAASGKAKGKNLKQAQTALTTIQDCIDFESLATGSTPAVVSTLICDVNITGFLPSVPTENRAMIFDSENPTGNDPDLAVNQGKILIISEDGDASDPDDANELGAVLSIDFSTCGDVTIESVVVIDVEQNQGETKDARIIVYDAADQILKVVTIPDIGDTQKMTLAVNQAGAARMDVVLDGSGAIDDICFSKQMPGGDSDCTRTIGYWKSRSGQGNGNQADEVSPLLPIWLGTSAGTKSVAVTTSAQAFLLLDQANCGNNASNGIGKLYSQLLGAKLNIAAGTDDTDAAAAISSADAFLENHDCGDWASLSSSEQADVLAWHATLDQYNNGIIGPGHCD